MNKNIIGRILKAPVRIGNAILRRTSWYRGIWQGAQKFWREHSFNLDIVNLGSGAGYHLFDYSLTDCNGENWALAPQSLVHDFNILKNYFSYIKRNGTVVITICPFSCLEAEYSKAHNLKYYTFLHPATILEFDENERIKAFKKRFNPFGSDPVGASSAALKTCLYRLLHKSIHHRKKSLKASADDLIAGWKKQFSIADLSAIPSDIHKSQIQSRKDTLKEIIEFCKARDLNPVILLPPMHSSLYRQFPDSFFNNYLNYFLKDLNVPVMNYMSGHNLNDADFNTAYFLNKNGAAKFTRQFIERINSSSI